MASFAQEYITLTPFNCVKECRALIQSPKQRNFLMAAALFGLYCGALIYRSYKQYLIEVENKREIEMQAEELKSEESYAFDPPPVTSKELLLPPIFDATEYIGDPPLTARSEIEPFITSNPLNTST